jgi:hypothetical protein
MKRRRRTPLSRDVTRPIVEKDEATGVAAGSPHAADERYADLKMPHERDERTHAPSAPSVVVTQAADDLAEGRRETDRYGKAGTDFDRTARRS